ncbi:MAG: hypothetical protein QMC90_05710, partial [Dehalococcoidales bacterium]|nr:hypothetical protein [Dehalococcoidales bacterium]
LYNLEELKHDVLQKILSEHAGENSAITQLELCHYYFDPYPIRYEDRALISNILQEARGIMQDHGWFLDWKPGKGWFAVITNEEAVDHLLRYTKREIRLHGRLQKKAHIATGNRYLVSSDHPLIEGIHGVTPAIQQLEEAVKQLEEGHEDENQD